VSSYPQRTGCASGLRIAYGHVGNEINTPLHDIERAVDEDGFVVASIKRLEVTFGFLEVEGSPRLFFHRSACSANLKFEELVLDQKVRCKIGVGTENRPCATVVDFDRD